MEKMIWWIRNYPEEPKDPRCDHAWCRTCGCKILFHLFQFGMLYLEEVFHFFFHDRFEVIFDKVTHKVVQLICKAFIGYTLTFAVI